MRRVLFDEDMPRQLRRDLPEFVIRTAQEEGWSSLRNGELLARAQATFDVLVTADRRMQYQQHIPRFTIGAVVIVSVDTRLPRLRSVLGQIRSAIERVQPGTVEIVTTA